MRVQAIAVMNAGRSSEVKKKEEQLGVIPSTVSSSFTQNAQMLTFLVKHYRKLPTQNSFVNTVK